MLTLTFRTPHPTPKKPFNRFLRWLRRQLERGDQWGWIMEWTAKGTEHFHLFFGDIAPLRGHRMEARKRRGLPVTLLRGPFERGCATAWLAATGDRSKQANAFNGGGILEALRAPDAAARYVAKETGKRAQKQAPDDRKHGRTWWTSYKDEVIERVVLPDNVLLPEWSTVFDAEKFLRELALDPRGAEVIARKADRSIKLRLDGNEDAKLRGLLKLALRGKRRKAASSAEP